MSLFKKLKTSFSGFGKKLESGFNTFGTKLKEGVQDVGSGIQQGAQAVGSVLEKGGDIAGKIAKYDPTGIAKIVQTGLGSAGQLTQGIGSLGAAATMASTGNLKGALQTAQQAKGNIVAGGRGALQAGKQVVATAPKAIALL